jgi:hypothetical protein
MNGYGSEFGISYRTLFKIFEVLSLRKSQAENKAFKLHQAGQSGQPQNQRLIQGHNLNLSQPSTNERSSNSQQQQLTQESDFIPQYSKSSGKTGRCDNNSSNAYMLQLSPSFYFVHTVLVQTDFPKPLFFFP